jgi:hypothetical protein
MEVALRADVPPERIRIDEFGRTYCAGLDTDDAYRPLCRSHHSREGALRAAAARSPLIAAAVRADELRAHHPAGHRPGCAVFAALDDLDRAAAALLAAVS